MYLAITAWSWNEHCFLQQRTSSWINIIRSKFLKKSSICYWTKNYRVIVLRVPSWTEVVSATWSVLTSYLWWFAFGTELCATAHEQRPIAKENKSVRVLNIMIWTAFIHNWESFNNNIFVLLTQFWLATSTHLIHASFVVTPSDNSLGLVFTNDGVGVVIISAEQYDLLKIKPTESEEKYWYRSSENWTVGVVSL